ncbi:MAG TPA: cytochrome P460 family protein [Steroidobacteraceae bacterium]|nr:cytochrome P460 family protein [Steroidobacteraceae bacterium]
MIRISTIVASLPVLCLLSSMVSSQAQVPAASTATSEAGRVFPEHYREWVYLSSGFDMSYRAAPQAGHHVFDNVFVDPDSYRHFLKTGTWRDGTMLVLEVRAARARGSINRAGNYQDEKVVGVEVHVKDEKHFADKWAFISFDDQRTGKLIPHTADCYSCHAAHAAVDTTFVQFYPTLLPIATREGTLARAYRQGE